MLLFFPLGETNLIGKLLDGRYFIIRGFFVVVVLRKGSLQPSLGAFMF